eukprot:9307990-Alexandrium_andersonii.AAC.1
MACASHYHMRQAVGLRVTGILSCDPKEHAVKFLAANFPKSQHHFCTLHDMQHPGVCQPCSWHPDAVGGCTVPDLSTDCDMFIAGFPCAPYSRMRRKSDGLSSGAKGRRCAEGRGVEQRAGWRDGLLTHLSMDGCS